MNSVFKRSDQLEEQIHTIKLKIPEWKVLFAIDGVMNPEAMADFLGISEKEVLSALKKFKDMDLVTTVGDLDEAVEDEFLTEAEEETTESSEPGMDESDFESLDFGLEEETTEEEVVTEDMDLSAEEPPKEEVSLGMEDETGEEPAVTEQKEGESLGDQEFDDFIGGLLNEEEGKEQSGMEIEEESPLDSEMPQAVEEAEEGKEEADLDLDNFFKEDVAEATVEMEEEEVAEEKLEVFDEEKIGETAEPETPEGEELPGKKKTVLVVDDSVVIRKMVEIALENEQFNIMSVANGKDALKYLDDNDPDIIILDIMLPDVNGLDVLKAVKASKQIPVVMLSAKDTPRETSKAKELGADDFIPKPFKDEELVGKIKELVGN